MHDTKVRGHQCACRGKKVIFRTRFAFDGAAKCIEDGGRLRVGRLYRGDVLPVVNEAGRAGMSSRHICTNPVSNSHTTCRSYDADQPLSIATRRGADYVCGDQWTYSQHNRVAVVDDPLIVY